MESNKMSEPSNINQCDAAAEEILDPTKNSKATKEDAVPIEEADAATTQVVSGNHTFLVSTIATPTTTMDGNDKDGNCKVLTAVLVSTTTTRVATKTTTSTTKTIENSDPSNTDIACDSTTSRAIVPMSSSLPSKILRIQAKRSAQIMKLQQSPNSSSLDSQFGSDEGATGGSGWESECTNNDCADIFDDVTPTAPPLPSPQPNNPSSLDEGIDDKLIDVGMGSSIEDSEESEVDDELKPLAIDNHVLHDVELSSSPSCSTSNNATATAAVLSEANLEKFHKHHHHNVNSYHHMDNIYLHPNFKYELDSIETSSCEASPPPAVAPANSPTEQKPGHRSFLTMKKPFVANVESEKANSTFSNSSTAEPGSEPQVNEIDILDPSLIPNDELAAEIAEAVEFYFSNDSILKDAFLLKHVRRNKEGFVSLKLVSSFKRVRQLTKEWRVVGNAVRRKSRKIELNDVGTKVRRVDPLPNFDETMPSRTIVACDLPIDKLTIEKVSDIFSKCGEIALIRILKPGMAIPVDVRQFMNKYPEMQQKECALVEYLESSSARDAKNLQGPFQVYEMVAPKKKTGKKAIIQVAAPVARMVENYRYFNDANYERTRGGSFSGVISHDTDLRYKLKRNNSDFHSKSIADFHHHNHSQAFQHGHHHHQHSPIQRNSFSSEHHAHQFQHYQPRNSFSSHDNGIQTVGSPSNSSHFYAYSPRRFSSSTNSAANLNESNSHNHSSGQNISGISSTNNDNNGATCTNFVRRLSNCSDNHSGYTETSRRLSNCSDNGAPQRRESNCSESCPCSRRVSDFGQQTESFRKISQGSVGSGERRFSNGSMQFERTFSNASELGNNSSTNAFPRRLSNDFNFERKQSIETQTTIPYSDNDNLVGGGGGGYNVFPRRYSNNFNASNKLAAYDNAQYINGRRISTDSGYDRRCSFGSEFEGSPRSRTSSFLSNYKYGNDFDGQPRSRTNSFLDGSPRSRSGSLAQRNSENLVRTPNGPDGSKGFGSRARKFGQTISPVN